MARPLPLALAACAILFASPALHAQSLGCVERPVGPLVDGAALGTMRAMQPQMPPYGTPSPTMALPHAPRSRGTVALPQMPMHGTECIAVAPPVRDILRGEPPPAGGLLRGDNGRSDLLRDAPPARPPIVGPR